MSSPVRLVYDATPRREERTVGLGDAIVTRAGDFVIVTHALGSCVGLTLWDPLARVGGMLHSQLPVSSLDPERAEAEPFLFTDTGVAECLRRLYTLGADRRRVVAKLAGCAEAVGATGSSFRVGQRNLAVARRVLWKNDIVIKGEAVADTRPRTLFLDMETGETTVRCDGVRTSL